MVGSIAANFRPSQTLGTYDAHGCICVLDVTPLKGIAGEVANNHRWVLKVPGWTVGKDVVGEVAQVMTIGVAWATGWHGAMASGSRTGMVQQSSDWSDEAHGAMGMMWAGAPVEMQCATAADMM